MCSNQSNTSKVIGYTSTWVEFEDDWFAQGASRYAYRGTFHGDSRLEGKPCVTKVYKEEWYEHLSESDMNEDDHAYRKAHDMARLFNIKYNTSKPIHFAKPEFTRVDTHDDTLMYKFIKWLKRKRKRELASTSDSVSNIIPQNTTIAVERYLEGDYVKFNSNTGYVNNDDIASPEAFSHFTYDESKGEVLVCDLQGVRTSTGYMFSDPAVLSGGTELGVYGPTDLGKFGIVKFFENHRCNYLCKGLRKPTIPNISPRDRVLKKIVGDMPTQSASMYTCQLSSLSGKPGKEVNELQNNLKLEAIFEDPIQPTKIPVQPTEILVQDTDMTAGHTEITSHPTEISVQPTDKPVPPIEKPVQPSEGPVQHTHKDESNPQKDQSVPQRDQSIPQKDQPIPQKYHCSQETNHSIPQKGKSNPQKDQSNTHKDHFNPQKGLSIPQRDQSIPQKDQSSPQKDQSSPQEDQSSQQKDQLSPQKD